MFIRLIFLVLLLKFSFFTTGNARETFYQSLQLFVKTDKPVYQNDNYVRKLRGVRGQYMFLSGSVVELAVKDLLTDVFNEVGVYTIEVEYKNNVVGYLEPKENGYMQFVGVPQSWNGTLKSTGSIQLTGQE